jgi:hypothetical protein
MNHDSSGQIGRRIGALDDLPPELRKLLNVAKLDDLEEKIVSTLNARYAGVASVDEILVGLYRDFQYIPEDRRTIANKLYRMSRAGHLERVAKRKGVFQVK